MVPPPKATVVNPNDADRAFRAQLRPDVCPECGAYVGGSVKIHMLLAHEELRLADVIPIDRPPSNVPRSFTKGRRR